MINNVGSELIKPVYLAPFVALTFLGACGGGTETVVEYPEVIQSQAERSYTDLAGEYLVRALVVANADQTQSLPTTGEIDFAGSAVLKRTEDTTVCTATSTCNMMGNADVTIDLDTMLLAGEIYDLDNNTAINWDGEMSLKGTVQTDGSITAELSGSYTNPAFGNPSVVAASNLNGSVLDYGAGTVNAINIEGDATVTFISGTSVAHSFGLIALSD